VVLPALLHGAPHRDRRAQEGTPSFPRLRAGNGYLPVVPLRRSAPGERGGVAEEAGGEEAPDGAELVRSLLPLRRGRLVRPADAGARVVRRHADVLLHPERARPAPRPHEPPAANRGVRGVLRGDDPSLRLNRRRAATFGAALAPIR